MNKYLLDYLYENVAQQLQDLGYYPANTDGEFSEKEFYKEVESLVDYVLEEQPVNVGNYVKQYFDTNLKI